MNKVIKEYPPEYCRLLEAAYGEGMMSEGGEEAIDCMFQGIAMDGKKALDIGAGLGGVACYLARKYAMDVTGLEINPWMVKEAASRAPAEIQEQLRFVLSTDENPLPFGSGDFDIVYSKGVLCHVAQKLSIFKECHRVLRAGGRLVITDCLSPVHGKWGGYIQRLIELEGLSLYAETVSGYREVLGEAAFSDIKMHNLSEQYAIYNEDIVCALKNPERKGAFIQSFGERLHEEAIEGYEAIASAMRTGELLLMRITAQKN